MKILLEVQRKILHVACMSNATATIRKTSKAALNEAVDSFFHRFEWLTGGTAEEVRRQADHGIKGLEELAAKVAELAANPAKPCAADSFLMKWALVTVPEKVAFYRERYVGQYEAWKAAQTPSNVIQFA